MIYFAKDGLTEHLYIVHKEIFQLRAISVIFVLEKGQAYT
jgi:hypothetical protein